MAGRRASSDTTAQPRQFQSVGEIDAAIAKLQGRISDVRKLAENAPSVNGGHIDAEILNPDRTVQFDNQRVRNVRSDIRNTIMKVFGSHSPEFLEHQFHEIWYGHEHVDMSRVECQIAFLRGIPQTVHMLEGLIHRLEENKADLPAQQREIVAPVGSTPTVFIIHGHDEAKRRELKDLLTGEFGLAVVIMQEEPGKSRTLIEKFEEEARECNAAIAIMTPDAAVSPVGGEHGQPRPNVIYELGWFAGKYGRDRTLMLVKEGTSIPSDLSGIQQIRFHDLIEEKLLELKREIDAWRGPKGEERRLHRIGTLQSQAGIMPRQLNEIQQDILALCQRLRDTRFEAVFTDSIARINGEVVRNRRASDYVGAVIQTQIRELHALGCVEILHEDDVSILFELVQR